MVSDIGYPLIDGTDDLEIFMKDLRACVVAVDTDKIVLSYEYSYNIVFGDYMVIGYMKTVDVNGSSLKSIFPESHKVDLMEVDSIDDVPFDLGLLCGTYKVTAV